MNKLFSDLIGERSFHNRELRRIRDEMWIVVKSMRRHVLPRIYKMLKMRFIEHLTLEECAKRTGVTRERIRQMETKALEQIAERESQLIRTNIS